MASVNHRSSLPNSIGCMIGENVNRIILPALPTKAQRRLQIRAQLHRELLNKALHTAMHCHWSVICFCPWVNGFDTKLH